MNIEMSDFSTYIKFFISLCALVNPIGMIPIFTSITSHQNRTERNNTNFIANLSVVIILCTSLFLGNYILELFGISINSFRIAGGILIIMIALSMLNGKLMSDMRQKNQIKSSISKNIAVVPLAMPLIAGPGAISSTIVWSTNYSGIGNILGCTIVIILFSILCWLLFKAAPFFVFLLGNTGINIITRIMGLLLMSLGIEFIITGIKTWLSI
ncbi:YchE family NAAT transporter [Buchnera aphidicola (Formosaphis micheliae)]|uniref:YchE family NAAT transporter n=1 Tax=Buchnera aphidicola TaxID=9 RepID=UPI0031B88A87